jgi:hypothetical protein
MFILVFFLLSLIVAGIALAVSKRLRGSRLGIVSTILLSLLVIQVGLMGLLTAYAHVFRPIQTSASIGWQTSPYEYEVGMADLTVGVLGVLCLFFCDNFWLATAVANAVWMWGDAIGHVRQMVDYNNHAANNAGLFLYAELLTPLIILLLVAKHRQLSARA